MQDEFGSWDFRNLKKTTINQCKTRRDLRFFFFILNFLAFATAKKNQEKIKVIQVLVYG